MPVLLNIRFLAAGSVFPGRVTDVSSRYLRTIPAALSTLFTFRRTEFDELPNSVTVAWNYVCVLTVANHSMHRRHGIKLLLSHVKPLLALSVSRSMMTNLLCSALFEP